MTEFAVLEDDIWETTPSARKGGGKLGELAVALLGGKTIFIKGEDSEKRLNGYYAIAQRKGFKMEVRKIERDGTTGRIARFIKTETKD